MFIGAIEGPMTEAVHDYSVVVGSQVSSDQPHSADRHLPVSQWSPSSIVLGSLATYAALALATALASTHRTVACAFADGESYCEMAAGNRGADPFSRRPLVPLVARAIGRVFNLSTGDSFRIVTAGGLLLLAGAIYFLTSALVRHCCATSANRHAIAAAAVLLWLTVPQPVRAWLMTPVLFDPVGSALLTAWLVLLVIPQRPALRFLQAFLVIAAALTRESTATLVIVACAAAVVSGVRSRRDVMPSVVAALLGLVVALIQPSQSFAARFPYHWQYRGTFGEISYNLRHWLHDPLGIARGLMIGIGSGAIALSPTIWRQVRSKFGTTAQDSAFLMVMAVVTVAALLQALFGGSDLGRLSSVAAPMLCIAVAMYLFTIPTRLRLVVTIVCVGAILVAVGAFATRRLDEFGYERFTLGKSISGIGLVVVLVALVVTIALSLNAGGTQARRDSPS